MNKESKILDTVLLLALPASGKSEVRRYMGLLSAEECGRDFHMGPTLQLDDFPYVHMMRRIDDELANMGQKRVYFQSSQNPFINPLDWGTLIHLLNEDYADLRAHRKLPENNAAKWLMDRFEAASKCAKIEPRLAKVDPQALAKVATIIEDEARAMLKEKNDLCKQDMTGKTVVIEFARGGPHGSDLPLREPFGYRYSLGELSQEILEKARILYIWVTPEESRRKNHERTNPNDPGSILHHGVPIEVMMNDYGCDDMDWLEANAGGKGLIPVKANGKNWNIPIARFDNRKDKTTFIRKDRAAWQKDEIAAVHNGLKQALTQLSEA